MYNYILKTINSYQNKILESVIHYFNWLMTFNYNMVTHDTQWNTLLPSTFPFLQYRTYLRLIHKLLLKTLLYIYSYHCTFCTLYILLYFTFMFIFVLISVLQNHKNSMLLYEHITLYGIICLLHFMLCMLLKTPRFSTAYYYN
jgi:hypothetical protein